MTAYSSLPSYSEFTTSFFQLIDKQAFPHAIMLNSIDGLPSVHIAESIATALLCTGHNKPCGKCQSCLLTTKRNHPDVLYTFPFISGGKMGSAGNYINEWKSFLSESPAFLFEEWSSYLDSGNKQLGIYTGETHRINEFQTMKPYLSQRKVIIMYLSELMHNTTANKLLKTLEEPLENTHIILITNHFDTNLKTITSRCQAFNVPSSSAEHFENEIRHLGVHYDPEISRISNYNLGLYLHLIQNKTEMLEFGEMFLSWLRHCFNKDIQGMFSDCEGFSSLSRDRLIIMLESFLKLFRDAFVNAGSELTGLQLTSMQRLSPFITSANAASIYTTLQKSCADLHRNANAKISLFESSLRISGLLHLKHS